jgi:RNA 3'-terminal phosphate cyclase (ATP)
MIILDGSQGEGGGQILRTALSLAAISGKPFVIEKIRARRPTPGLMAQHILAVKATAQITNAHVEGAEVGSLRLTFTPQGLRPGKFHWDIRTAGATSLVLQTVLLPLSFAATASEITIIGGTHVPWSPCYHYLALHWLVFLEQIGFRSQLNLQRAGFYPQGGGQITAVVTPHHALQPLDLLPRGDLIQITAYSGVANLDQSIAERQARQGEKRLNAKGYPIHTNFLSLPAVSPGSIYLLLARFENSQCCYFSLGARGKRAEIVADEAVDAFFNYLKTNQALDPYLVDQLLLPLAFAPASSSMSTSRITEHLLTNLAVMQKFLDISYRIEGNRGEPGAVFLTPGNQV